MHHSWIVSFGGWPYTYLLSLSDRANFFSFFKFLAVSGKAYNNYVKKKYFQLFSNIIMLQFISVDINWTYLFSNIFQLLRYFFPKSNHQQFLLQRERIWFKFLSLRGLSIHTRIHKVRIEITKFFQRAE
jgi:hypothetical protein